jgi:hypothetical protein
MPVAAQATLVRRIDSGALSRWRFTRAASIRSIVQSIKGKKLVHNLSISPHGMCNGGLLKWASEYKYPCMPEVISALPRVRYYRLASVVRVAGFESSCRGSNSVQIRQSPTFGNFCQHFYETVSVGPAQLARTPISGYRNFGALEFRQAR